MAKIKAPNSAYNGVIGDVVFKDGVAETDNQAVIQYCRGAGYEVDGRTDNPASTPLAAVDSRDVTEETVGARLRDAAVDPRPEDFLPPVNAGKADPHGPEVVSPGIHAVSGPGPIVPGAVLNDLAGQQARETEAAERVLAGNELVPDVTADMATQGQAVDEPAAQVEPPAGNASAEEWRTYAVDQHGADPERVAGMKRDDLRAEFGPKAE